jgi:acyl-CoA dehydrogenase
MQFEFSYRAKAYQTKLLHFMDECVYPAEPVYAGQMAESGKASFHPPILEELKTEARKLGLWNLFHPHQSEEWRSPGLSNLDYAPLAEITGRSPDLAPEALNCNAPDIGNMEVLQLFGTDEHKEKWLKPLLAGEIASAFAMTEPAVASSDARFSLKGPRP